MKNKILIYIFIIFITNFISCKSKATDEIKPIRNNIVEVVFASGTLEFDDKFAIMAQNEGNIIHLYIEEGNTIVSNQIVAEVDNQQYNINETALKNQLAIAEKNASENAPALLAIKANINAAKAKLEQDILQENRYKELLEEDAVTKKEFEQYQLSTKNSKENLIALQEQYQNLKLQNKQILIQQQNSYNLNIDNLKKNKIKSTISGKVITLYKQKGDYIKRGEVLALVANNNKIYAQLNVDEDGIDKVKIGQDVIVQLNTQKTKKYKAKVSEIMPQFDVNSQSFLVKIIFDELPSLLINGTQLEANIITGQKENALLIPRQYMYYGNKVQLKDDEKLTTVKPGIISTEYVEILEGISENDILVSVKPTK